MFLRRSSLFAVVLTASLCQFPIRADQPEDELRGSLKTFTQVFEAIETNFADKVDVEDALYKGAIPGMLRTLDPHSSFFDPKANQLFRENQAGRYYGVGMYIWAPDGHVQVNYPFVGSPAYKAGLRPADVILSVNDKDTQRMTIAEVSALLKGPRGTPAQITVRREGKDKPLVFNVVRDQVPRDSVTYAYWMRPGLAFVKIESFNENTSKEIDRALARLGESKIEGLILDLRDNPGGLVSEAVGVADHFLRKGQGIVSHHGRASAETKFNAKHGEKGPEYPMVVLVDKGTASAAEILSGALQDHDRAWILGESTFGKGLVQAPFQLSGDSALLLTIAKYYTPSGRLIQRDYAHRSFYEYYNRLEGQKNYKDAKKTDGGRTVYGGDGIAPDEPFETPKLTALEAQLSGRLLFFRYASHYFASHPAQLSKDWRPGPEEMKDFREYSAAHGAKVEDADFEHDQIWIQERLREELFITAFSKEDSQRVELENDPEVLKAIDSLPRSKALLEQAKAMVARQGKQHVNAVDR
jgi:carboxyl-terminal processing protease